MDDKKEFTNGKDIQPPKPDDDWDLPISREEWEEIMEWDEMMQEEELNRIALETLDWEEEERRQREEEERRSRRNRYNHPYILDMYGGSYEGSEEPVDTNEW